MVRDMIAVPANLMGIKNSSNYLKLSGGGTKCGHTQAGRAGSEKFISACFECGARSDHIIYEEDSLTCDCFRSHKQELPVNVFPSFNAPFPGLRFGVHGSADGMMEYRDTGDTGDAFTEDGRLVVPSFSFTRREQGEGYKGVYGKPPGLLKEHSFPGRLA